MKEHYLAILRDKSLGTAPFRRAALSLAALIAEEVVEPLGAGERVVLIPILRAGLALLPSFLERCIESPVGFFGIWRDEATAHPRLYYENIPLLYPSDRALILDPMLATAGSASLAIEKLQEKKFPLERVTVVSIISSRKGKEELHRRYPQISHYTVAVDPSLDANQYIVPGLGDFGDRFFGT